MMTVTPTVVWVQDELREAIRSGGRLLRFWGFCMKNTYILNHSLRLSVYDDETVCRRKLRQPIRFGKAVEFDAFRYGFSKGKKNCPVPVSRISITLVAAAAAASLHPIPMMS
ncbi:hypothetical protein M8C21_003337 [Ambrosia artemisiifolia]|uniref:Uncharacterized protein n=1 Tax=Ambrosia artemisiifolia TaxID=4212 RepID=A0AAD5BRJ0_AMBAR|nr:hypothetical protein M8C21_003337 [Ambrosia artemisiifolia]